MREVTQSCFLALMFFRGGGPLILPPAAPEAISCCCCCRSSCMACCAWAWVRPFSPAIMRAAWAAAGLGERRRD